MTPVKNTKDHILTTAKKLFAKQGFEATSMSEIAERVGIEKASLYYFFKNKDGLFAAISEQNWSGLAEELRNNPALNQTDKITRDAFTQYLIHIIKSNMSAGLALLDFNMCVAASPHQFGTALKHRAFMIKKLREYFKYQKIPNIPLAETLFTTAIQGYTVQSQLQKPAVSAEAFGRYLTDLIFNTI